MLRKIDLYIITILATFCVIAACISVNAATQAIPVQGGYVYFDNTTGKITRSDYTITAAVIPEEYNGVKITAISEEAFAYRYALKSVSLPDTITTIGNSAFEGCDCLTDLIISGNVTSIGGYAFYECGSLKNITINISDIKNYLERPNCLPYYLPNSSGACLKYLYQGSVLNDLVIPEGTTQIGSYALYCCESLKNVSIPDGVTTLGNYSFANCSSIECIDVPDSVEEIGWWAFAWCKDLSSVILRNGLATINDYAFLSCTSLKTITIPDTVECIWYGAFEDCSALTSISIPNGVELIDDYTFHGCINLTNVNLGNGITSIGLYAFDGCSKLATLNIPNNVTTIGTCAFRDCGNLKTIEIPAKVNTIGTGAFAGCDGLEKLYLKCKKRNSITINSFNGVNYGIIYYDCHTGYETLFGEEAHKVHTYTENVIKEATDIEVGCIVHSCVNTDCSERWEETIPAYKHMVSGSVIGCEESATITVELTRAGEAEPVHSVTCNGKFFIGNIETGEYVLSIAGPQEYVVRLCPVQMKEDSIVVDTALYKLGDTDMDGAISASDVTQLARYVAHIITITDPYHQALTNTDREGDTSASDVTQLARYVAHIISSL